jgi:uncharacterized lipoprotein YbaY
MTDDPEDLGYSEGSNNRVTETNEKKGWMIAAFVVVTTILLGILAYAMFSSSGVFGKPGVFITITEPVQGALLDTASPVTVSGLGGGLFEGNVVVQALDVAGDVLTQQPTTIDAPDAGTGGEGPWSVELAIESMPGTQGRIVAFSTSPADGTTIASDSVDVTFGEAIPGGEMVKLEDHHWVLVALDGESLIENTLINLQFENFRAQGSGGCNRYFTSYESRGSSLNFGLVTSTAKSCELPVGVMDQEEEYFAALEQAAAFTHENQKLKVFNGSNDLILVYNAVVIGTVVVPEGTELLEDSVVHIRLEDVSIADIEAKLIAEQIITSATDFPIPFMVIYNAQEINEKNTYAIGVRIEDNSGNFLYINTTAYPVITRGNPSEIEVMVEAVH